MHLAFYYRSNTIATVGRAYYVISAAGARNICMMYYMTHIVRKFWAWHLRDICARFTADARGTSANPTQILAAERGARNKGCYMYFWTPLYLSFTNFEDCNRYRLLFPFYVIFSSQPYRKESDWSACIWCIHLFFTFIGGSLFQTNLYIKIEMKAAKIENTSFCPELLMTS
jgi:hypothetical protein